MNQFYSSFLKLYHTGQDHGIGNFGAQMRFFVPNLDQRNLTEMPSNCGPSILF